MDEHPIFFSVLGQDYTAKFVVMEGGFPLQFHVYELNPNNYQSILPYIFQVLDNGDWTFPANNTLDTEFGNHIANAIYLKCRAIGIDLGKKDSK